MKFGQAYLIATCGTTLLIDWYARGIFKQWLIVLLFSFILPLLYLFIYIIIQFQDDALLFGSNGLFVLLFVIMYFSRKIKWDNAITDQNVDRNIKALEI